MPFDPASYGPTIAALLTEPRLAELGPGRPNPRVRGQLAGSTIEQLFAGRRVHDAAMASCCLSALFLYHDYLDESHKISQDIETPTGSFWHGIMHRREPDYGNSKYWFRRVGEHPILEALTQATRDFRNPFDFVDQCEKQSGAGTPEEMTLRQVQQKEWELLFDWCFRRAADLD